MDKGDRLDFSSTKRDRLVTFLKRQEHVDCTFKIDGMDIKAHKLILAGSSPVFEKMFYGDMAQDVIEISDISVNAFNQMLGYVYTESIDISSVIEAWNLYYIANKYLLDELKLVCLEYIEKNNLSITNLVLSYEYAEMYELLDIRKKCSEDMVNYVSGVLFCDYHIKPSTLRHILDQITSPSFNLLIKVIQWSIVECEFRQEQILSNNVANILKKENIINYFQKDCYDIRNFQQINDNLIKQTLGSLKDLLKWSEEPFDLSKTPNIIPKFCLPRSEYKIARRVDLHPNEDFASGFMVSKSMFIFGISIVTPMKQWNLPPKPFYDGQVTVRLCTCDFDSNLVEPMKFKVLIPYDAVNYYLNFYNLALIEPKKLYFIRISFNSPDVEGTTALHCIYMSNTLLCENTKSSINFCEFNGSFIRGISFYPV